MRVVFLLLMALTVFLFSCAEQSQEYTVVYRYPQMVSQVSGETVYGQPQPVETRPAESKGEDYARIPYKQINREPKEFTVEINEFGAYPDTVEVNQNDFVRIHFKATAQYVSKPILVKSRYFTTKKLLANEEDAVEFTVQNEDFNFGIYKYDSTKKLADGKVLIDLN